MSRPDVHAEKSEEELKSIDAELIAVKEIFDYIEIGAGAARARARAGAKGTQAPAASRGRVRIDGIRLPGGSGGELYARTRRRS